MADLYYFNKKRFTAKKLFEIEKIAINEAVEKELDLFFFFHMLIPSEVSPGIFTISDYPIILSKN